MMFKIISYAIFLASISMYAVAEDGNRDKHNPKARIAVMPLQYFVIRVDLDDTEPPNKVSKTLSEKIKSGSRIYTNLNTLTIIMQGNNLSELFTENKAAYERMKEIPGVRSIVSVDAYQSLTVVE